MLIIKQKEWQSFLLTSYRMRYSRVKKKGTSDEGGTKTRRTVTKKNRQQRLLIIVPVYIRLKVYAWYTSDTLTRWSVTMQAEHHLDISINLSTFFLKNIGVWISHDPSERRRMRMLLACTVWMLLLGIVINARDLYFALLYNGVSMSSRIFLKMDLKFEEFWFLNKDDFRKRKFVKNLD